MHYQQLLTQNGIIVKENIHKDQTTSSSIGKKWLLTVSPSLKIRREWIENDFLDVKYDYKSVKIVFFVPAPKPFGNHKIQFWGKTNILIIPLRIGTPCLKNLLKIVLFISQKTLVKIKQKLCAYTYCIQWKFTPCSVARQ